MAVMIPCNNPAHGVASHVAGSAAEHDCSHGRTTAATGGVRTLPSPSVSVTGSHAERPEGVRSVYGTSYHGLSGGESIPDGDGAVDVAALIDDAREQHPAIDGGYSVVPESISVSAYTGDSKLVTWAEPTNLGVSDRVLSVLLDRDGDATWSSLGFDEGNHNTPPRFHNSKFEHFGRAALGEHYGIEMAEDWSSASAVVGGEHVSGAPEHVLDRIEDHVRNMMASEK